MACKRTTVTRNNNELSTGDFINGDVRPVIPQVFPFKWTCSVMISCLFLTGVLMPMLAVFIPRAPRTDLPWWQRSSLYRINIRQLHNTVGDIKGVTRSAEYLQQLGVAAVLLDGILPAARDKQHVQGVTSYYTVDPEIGGLDHFKQIIQILHDRGIQVVVNLEINHSHASHPWFQASRAADSKYADYYVWENGKTTDNGHTLPPNNWLSVTGGSAWTFDPTRKQFYLHQFHESLPDLNFYNPSVIQEISSVISFWLEQGVDGFHINNTDYLVESPQVTYNEPRSCNHDALPSDYSYLLHPYTHQVSFIHNITREWRSILDQHQLSSHKHILLLLESWPLAEGEDLHEWNQHNQDKSQLSTNYALRDATMTQPCGGTCLRRLVSAVRDLRDEDALLTWTTGHADPGSNSEIYSILVTLLPGTPIINAGQESAFPQCPVKNFKSLLDKSDSKCQESVETYRNLLELRQEPAFLWGRLEYAVTSENVFSFYRYAKGWSYTRYLVTVNVGATVSQDSYTDLSPLVKCPVQGTLAARTQAHPDRTDVPRIGDRLTLTDLKLYPGEGFVIALK